MIIAAVNFPYCRKDEAEHHLKVGPSRRDFDKAFTLYLCAVAAAADGGVWFHL